DDRAELVLRLGAALAYGEVAPDAAMGFRGAAIEGDEGVERLDRLCYGGAWREGAGIEAVERLGRHARRSGDVQHLARQGDEERTMAGRGQAIRDRGVGERGGKQHRTIGELRPKIAPDVRGEHGALLEVAQEP